MYGEIYEKYTEDTSSQKTRTLENILNTAWSGVTTIVLLLFRENSINNGMNISKTVDYLTNKVAIIAHCRNISGVATEDSELINYL